MLANDTTSRIAKVLSDAVERGDVPGVVAIAAEGGRTVYEGAFGVRSLRSKAPMTLDTVFWYASMTKALVATGAMQLVERGLIDLDEPVGRVLPELAAPKVLEGYDTAGKPILRPAKRPITLRQLLTHTSGFGSDIWSEPTFRFMQENRLPPFTEAKRRTLTSLPMVRDPGEKWEYGLSIDWTGQLIEAVSGLTLEAYLRQHVFDPLGARDAGFVMGPSQKDRRADVHQRRADGSLDPSDHEVSQTPEVFIGGGGLYGTADDYRVFLEMLLNGGRSRQGKSVLKPETVALMGQNHIGDLNVERMVTVIPEASHDTEFFPAHTQKWGLSFLINTEKSPNGRSAGSLSWAGLSNCFYWLDPARGVYGILMTQILPFCDPASLRLYEAFERAVYDEIA